MMSWSDELPQYMRNCIDEAPAHDKRKVLRLVLAARSGDAKAEDALARQFMGLALSVATAMERDFSHRIPTEDFLQAALEGLLETIRSKFDPARENAKFTTVAWWWMRKRCFELAATIGYPVKKPRGAPIGTVPLDTPPGIDEPAVADIMMAGSIDPESSTLVSHSWRSMLSALTSAVDSLEENQRASVIRRRLADASILPLLDVPNVSLHRITLWKKERQAMRRLRELMDAALSPVDVIDTLRMIDSRRGINGFDDCIESACAP